MNINGATSGTSDYSRITGLATGMDTDGMVNKAVAGDKMKIDYAKQNRQIVEWQQEAYVGMIKDLKEFYNSYLDVLAPADTNMMTSAIYSGFKAESSDASKISVNAYGGALKGTYSVKINQLAEAAKKQTDSLSVTQLTSNSISTVTGANWNGKTITFDLGAGLTKDITFGENEVSDGMSLSDIATLIQSKIDNDDILKTKNINVGVAGDKLKFISTNTDEIKIKSTTVTDLTSLSDKSINKINSNSKLSDLGIGINSGELKITVKGKEFIVNVDSNKSIGEFINDVRNTKSASGEVLGNYINISFSELTKKLTIESKDTGASENMVIADSNGGNLAVQLKIDGTHTGKNAKVEITPPGETVGISVEKPTNSFTIDNINYNLVGGSSGDTVTINVKPDATDKVEKFKKFVEKYNSLIEKINKKVTEKREYKFKPLTDDQKKDMKEDEIRKWEEKAKQGMLSRESNLSNILMQVRQVFYSTVEGAGITAQDIGIETTSNWRDGGKLKLNEEKLKTALETKGDQVQKLFTQSSTNKNEQGILQRLKETFNQYIGSDGILVKKAGYENTRWAGSNDLSKSIEQKNNAIKELEKKMYAKQDRYYKLFAALEKNMNQLNSQSNWLASQLGAR